MRNRVDMKFDEGVKILASCHIGLAILKTLSRGSKPIGAEWQRVDY
jgi:hypothetical protein